MSNMINTSRSSPPVVIQKRSSAAHSGSSSLASNLSGVSPSPVDSPLSLAESISEGGRRCFSQNSAGGKPLPVVDGEKHIQALHLHLDLHLTQGESSVGDVAAFHKVMNQGDESCLRASNILHGTKAALAMFCMLPVEKRNSVTAEAKSFYTAMAKLSKDSAPVKRQKAAEQKLEKFNNALLKASGLTNKSADKQSNLEKLCTDYLNEFVYSDVIEKLSYAVTPEQLKVIKGDPEKLIEALYHDLNENNNRMTRLLSDGFIAHQGVNDKAAQMHELITKLEHKTEIIAGIISKSFASDSPAASPIATRDLPDFPAREAAPDYNMASPATPNHGIQSPAISSVISPVISPVFNNNFGELAPALNKIADVLVGIHASVNRLLPGNGSAEPTRHMESIEVGNQKPEAPLEIDPPTYAEAVEPLQSEKIQLKPTAPLMATPIAQKEPTIEDATNFVSTRSVVLSQPEAPAAAPPKKSMSSLNALGTFLGTNGALPTYGKADAVALTNGAISGSSQSASYRNSDTSQFVSQFKSVPPADSRVGEPPRPEQTSPKPMAPMTPPMAQKVLTSGDDIDGASTPPPVAAQPETPTNVVPEKATYSLNAQGSPVGTNGALSSYKEVPRVALTNGAISGSTQSASYASSDTNGFVQIKSASTNEQLAEALKKREEQSAKLTKSVNSAGSAFQGLYSAQSRTLINFTPKNKTTEYRLNESLNGNAN